MKPTNDARDRLLAETFDPEWAGATLPRRVAARLRWRRRARKAAAAVIVVGAALGLPWMLREEPKASITAVPAPPAATTVNATPGYELITDEELFAQLPDAAWLIVETANGQRSFTLLGRVPGQAR